MLIWRSIGNIISTKNKSYLLNLKDSFFNLKSVDSEFFANVFAKFFPKCVKILTCN